MANLGLYEAGLKRPTRAVLPVISVGNLTLGGTSSGNTVGPITTGTGTVTKNTAATWTISGTSSYTGVTTLSAGQLNINSATEPLLAFLPDSTANIACSIAK